METSAVSNRTRRTAVAAYFFIFGLCFATWASRIPAIKSKMGLNDAQLGGLLLALPVGSMLSLPFSGWLVNRFGSRAISLFVAVAYPGMLVMIGLADSIWILAPVGVCFGFLASLCNVAINTQAVGVENLYGRSIMASFHGIWSLAGFTGAAVGSLMVSKNIQPHHHFMIICGAAIALMLVSQRYIIRKDASHPDQPFFAKPDAFLLQLGLITFCSMVCEGSMFDWSGVYFQKVVQAPAALTTLGYTSFMATMAGGRFLGDYMATRFGKQKVLQGSGVLIATGLLTSVAFPNIVTAAAGFALVGFGVSSVVPLVYSTAAKSKTLSPGIAITAVSSVGFLGFLLGPPVIGFIAEALSLRASFTLIACLGLGTTLISSLIKWD